MYRGETGRWQFAVLALGMALCLGAVALIASFLGDSHPEETIAELGYTAAALTVFGPCAVAGLFLVARRSNRAPFGYLTAAIAMLGFVAVTVRLIEGMSTFYGDSPELQVIALVLTLTLAQASLALAYDRSDDPLALRLVTLVTVVVILGLGVLGALVAAFDSFRPSVEIFGVLFTLFLLGAALLVLFRLTDWLFRDRLPDQVRGDVRCSRRGS
ncbi:MAG TPA: hypothetical protein VN522_06470 [Solirubrobacterales bacterium]|nr:hypothetical protein [Solirubrobacterales bacterium]